MSLIGHHTSDPICGLCESKLETAHVYMADWFRSLKKKYINVHVSWAYRDRIAQEKAFAEGETQKHFPESPHNRTNPETHKPESYALDIFQIDDDGVGRFSQPFYSLVAQQVKENALPIRWGGNFKTLGDYNHFQYSP